MVPEDPGLGEEGKAGAIAPEPQSVDFLDRAGGRGPLYIALGITVGGLILVVLFAILLLRSDESEEVTPTAEGTVETIPVAEDFFIEAVSDSGAFSVTLESPAFLDITGESFSVQPQIVPRGGVWEPTMPGESIALWVFGSVVNYVFGIADSESNRALLEQLALGDEVVITTRSGSSYTFAFSGRELVSSGNRDVFAQHTPGITLLLMTGDPDEQRLVATGRYVVSDAIDESQEGRVVELGETAQLDDLQITLTSVTYQFDRPELPAGFAFYLLDYRLANMGVASFSANTLQLTLADEMGNLYALNPTASQLGNHRMFSGSLSPGQAVQATAGYQLPAGLTSPVLRWQIVRNDTGSEVQVTIPFGEEEGAGQQTSVLLQQAEVSVDGTSVVLNGELTNLGARALAVGESDVTLSGDGTIYLLFSTNPGFPWIVNPGQTTPFSVTFQRPSGDSAIFQILTQPFQLTGLR